MTWVMLEKNGKIYKYKMFDNTHLFNRGLMDVQIEGWNPEVPMNYDDIICVRSSCVKLESLPVLPLSLQEFELQHSDLNTVPVFPKGIKKILLLHTKIEMTDEKWAEIRSQHPKAFIQIDNPDIFMFRGKPVDPQQGEHLRVAREQIRQARMDTRPLARPITVEDIGNRNVLNSTETVHITSINNCVCKAIDIIVEKSRLCPDVDDPIKSLFEKPNTRGFLSGIYDYFFKQQGGLRISLKGWCNDRTEHSLHKLTFGKLFQMIMKIAEAHPQKAELKERIITELTESIGMCFTGRINRLVNSLVGYVDGIMIGITVLEMTQIRIQGLVKRLIDKKIDVEQAKTEMAEIFNEVGEEDGISKAFKEANIMALDDYSEDETG